MSDKLNKTGIIFGVGILACSLIYMSWKYIAHKKINRINLIIDNLKIHIQETNLTDYFINSLNSKEKQINSTEYVIKSLIREEKQINQDITDIENKRNITKYEAEELRDKLFKLTSYPILLHKIDILALIPCRHDNTDIEFSSYEKMKQSIVSEMNKKEEYLTIWELNILKLKLSECDKLHINTNECIKENDVEYKIF